MFAIPAHCLLAKRFFSSYFVLWRKKNNLNLRENYSIGWWGQKYNCQWLGKIHFHFIKCINRIKLYYYILNHFGNLSQPHIRCHNLRHRLIEFDIHPSVHQDRRMSTNSFKLFGHKWQNHILFDFFSNFQNYMKTNDWQFIKSSTYY